MDRACKLRISRGPPCACKLQRKPLQVAAQVAVQVARAALVQVHLSAAGRQMRMHRCCPRSFR
eukprot:15011873-Alexandrium_andersonii.AAC.1